MRLFSFAILASSTLAEVSPAVAQSYQPTWAHFATEEANKVAPSYNLSRFGIDGGQLPKTYDLLNGTAIIYNPEASWKTFQEILAGKYDRTNIPNQSPNIQRDLQERDCNSINLSLFGSCGIFNYINTCVDPASCIKQGCQWDSVTVYSVTNAYITFWASDACNGAKGSFNPHCNQNTQQNCQFNIHWKSFRVYSGCHDTFQSNC